MGGGSSRELRIPIGGVSSVDGSRAEAVQKLEEALFKAGYAHGREDALSGIEGEVSRATRAAYGALVLEEEAARATSLDAAVLALERAHPRPPVRAAACAAEEAALLACSPGSDAGHCSAPARAYVLCADRVLYRMMHPAAAKAPLE